MARKRRSKSLVALAAVALVLWLWLGGPMTPDDVGESTGERTAPAATPVRPAQPPIELEPEPPHATVLPDPSGGALADRFAGELFVLEQAFDAGRLSVAWRVVEAAEEHGWSEPFATRLQERRLALETATRATFDLWRQLVEQGSILEVERLIRTALDQGLAGPFEPLLRNMLSTRGWPLELLAVEPPPEAPNEPTAPIPERGRFVSYLEGHQIRNGRVQSVTGRSVTLRLTTEQGVTFPALPLHRLVFSDPTPEEIKAFAETAPLPRAALWFAHLVERGLGHEPRVQAIRARFSWPSPGGIAPENDQERNK